MELIYPIKPNTMTLQEAKDKAAQEAGYENFAEYQCEIFSTSEVLDRAMEIYAEGVSTYWEQRCKLVEIYLNESPCDPDITKEQIDAWHNYQNFLKSTKP